MKPSLPHDGNGIIIMVWGRWLEDGKIKGFQARAVIGLSLPSTSISRVLIAYRNFESELGDHHPHDFIPHREQGGRSWNWLTLSVVVWMSIRQA